MTDPDIALLRDCLNMGQTIVWMPNHDYARRVIKIDVDAYRASFEHSICVDLRECHAHDFVQVVPIFLALP